MSDVRLHHDIHGPDDAPPVLLAPSLGTTLALWDELTGVLSDRFRVIRFDTRGHGGSPVPPGPYTVDELAADVVELADTLGAERFGLVGLSIGGAIGQTIAVEHAARLSALVLCCTGPAFGDPQNWRDRAEQVRAEGMSFLAEPTKGRWFTPDFLRSRPEEVDRLLGMLASTSPEGYAACCDALASHDLTDRIGEIRTPTRIIAGAHDPVCTPEVGRLIADRIPDSDLVVLDDAAHIANVAQPERFNAAVLQHLEKHL